MAELEQMAQEKGVSVEELIQQLIGGVGGSDDSQEAPAADTGGMEIAAADKTNVKAAAPKRASATKNAAEVHRIVKELMSRSRR
jgi:hypothetical protein